MKNFCVVTFTFFLMFKLDCLQAQSVHQGELAQTRRKLNINSNWKFQRDTVPANFASTSLNDSEWETISVPHTMQLESVDISHIDDEAYHQVFQRYIGWYRKTMLIHTEPGQKVFLEFEGVHQITRCWVNGTFVGEHAISGYTPFHFDITNYVNSNSMNTIVLSVDNRPNPNIPPDGDELDYIKFSGLYRDVYLVIANPVYITFPWEDLNAGVFITTPTVTPEDATINIKATVRNEQRDEAVVKVLNRIIDANGYVVQSVESTKTIAENTNYTFTQTTGITEDVHLWSIDNPYLYRVQTLVYANGLLVDLVENPLGIRKAEFIKGRGFVLNDKVIELIGVNKHQAYPYIGDAVPDALHIKDAIQIKRAGFNTVRLAHYPHDNAFINACNKLGLLIIEEAPSWIAMRRGRWFDNLIEANRRMIRNHRNNPSIIMWSGGINHRGPVEQLHYSCKEEDPTRPTGSNGAPWTGPRYSGVTDIYTPMDYVNTPVKDIDLSFLCEHGSSKDAYRNQFEISLSRQSVSRVGVAMWTAHDYFSFKHKWDLFPRRPFSIYRVPNPVMYWYQSEMNTSPMVYIADQRASTAGEVHVFSNCNEVELYNNGTLVARQYPDSDPERMYCNSPSFTFNLSVPQADLTAKGYRNGILAASYKLPQPGKPYQLKLVIEDDNIPFEANGWDIRMVHAYILDKNGNHVISDTSLVNFTVKGAGTIIGDAEIAANPNKAYWGTASALLRSTDIPGQITVTATGKGLKPSEAIIATTYYEPNRTLAETKPVYDYPTVRVDMGNPDQLLQFTWDGWLGNNPDMESLELSVYNNARVAVLANGGTLHWTSNYGMSGNLPYLAMDGVYTTAKGELILTMSNLPKGEYRLKTYHHSHEKIQTEQGLAILIKNSNVYKLNVTDAKGHKEGVAWVELSSGSQIDNTYPASVSFKVRSDGTNDIKISITNPTQKVPVIMNGFNLKRLK